MPGATYVRRRVGEEYKAECVVPTVKFGGGSIMVWGCMSAAGTGKIFICEGRMNSEKYTSMLDQVLQPSIYKIFNNCPPQNVLFQQDNAPCHTAANSRRWFQDRGIKLLQWPAQSPDLNPIEHLWGILKKRVLKHKCSRKNELVKIIKEEWEKITPEICCRLVQSMPNRVKAVIRARGGQTKY